MSARSSRTSCARPDAAARPRRPARARTAGVGSKRGAGGLRRHVHLALGRAGARGRLAHRRQGGRARREARDLARARPAARRRELPTRSSSSRARARRMIVRWGIEELPALAGERPLVVASPRWRARSTPPTAGRRCRRTGSRCRRRRHDRRDRRRQRDRHRQGGLGRERAAARLGADDLLRRRVDVVLRRPRPDRRMRGGGAGANLHAIVYEPELTLELPVRRRSARR